MGRGDHNKNRALQNEQRIVDMLAEKPMTIHELARELEQTVSSLYAYRSKLMAEPKRIHICGYQHTGHKPSPIYAAGEKPDVEHVGGRKPKQEEDRKDKQCRKMLALLADGEQTAEQASLSLHLSVSRVRFYLRELREEGSVYIKRWKHPGKQGDLAPVYALGCKTDAIKPRETRAQRFKKEKANRDAYERTLAKRRAKHAIQRAKTKPVTWLSALGMK